MNAIGKWVLSVGLVATLAACGSVSKLTHEDQAARRHIADYSRVEVLDFASNDADSSDSAERQAEYTAEVAVARKLFADKIAEQITASGAFTEVSRSAGAGPALRITGTITEFDKGNIVARGLTGFLGRTRFDATVQFVDARSGDVLSTMAIDRNSWPLPVGASLSTLQTTGFFMNEAAKKIADELAGKKKG